MDGNLRKIFRTKLATGFHWQSVESPLTSGGIPDSNYCSQGVEGWVEFKNVKGWRVVIRPEQIGWLERRARVGGRCYIAARKAGALWLYKASAARLLTGARVDAIPAALLAGHWQGGPAKWDWPAIAAILTEYRQTPANTGILKTL